MYNVTVRRSACRAIRHYHTPVRIGRADQARANIAEDVERYAHQYEVNDNENRTYRKRQHGNKSLPLPAVMDPIWTAARYKHTKPKISWSQAKPDEITDFQKELAEDPYAQALASDLRMCSLTRARVPSHFLVPFYLDVSSSTTDDATKPSHTSALKPRLGAMASVPGSSTYVVNSQAAVNLGGENGRHNRMLNDAMLAKLDRVSGGSRKKSTATRWDVDLAVQVRQGLQEVAIRDFSTVLRGKYNRTAFVELEATSNHDIHVKALCVIELGEGNAVVGKYAGDKPVFQLTQLLSEEQTREIARHANKTNAVWLLLAGAASARACRTLLRLQAFSQDQLAA